MGDEVARHRFAAEIDPGGWSEIGGPRVSNGHVGLDLDRREGGSEESSAEFVPRTGWHVDLYEHASGALVAIRDESGGGKRERLGPPS